MEKFGKILLGFIFFACGYAINLKADDIGIFGEFNIKPCKFKESPSLFAGSRIGVIIYEKLAVSVTLNQLALSQYVTPFLDDSVKKSPNISMYLYGLDIEYYITNGENWAYSAAIGAGQGEFSFDNPRSVSDIVPAYQPNYFPFVEPRISLSLKAKTYYRFIFSIGYRMVLDNITPTGSGVTFTKNELSSPFLSLALQFGSLF